VDSKAEIPDCRGIILSIDFKGKKIKRQDMAMVALSLLAQQKRLISLNMLEAALGIRFKGKTLEGVLELVQRSVTIDNYK
jgi:hypothetical protein